MARKNSVNFSEYIRMNNSFFWKKRCFKAEK